MEKIIKLSDGIVTIVNQNDPNILNDLCYYLLNNNLYKCVRGIVLSNCEIGIFPDMTFLVNLEAICIEKCVIDEFNFDFLPTKCKKVMIPNNNLTCKQLLISHHSSVVEINVTKNLLTNFNSIYFPKLTTLICDENNIIQFNDYNFLQLSNISIMKNNLAKVVFNNYYNTICASKNRLTSLNTTILGGVKYLNLSHNSLTKMIGKNLAGLEVIDVSHNKITKIKLPKTIKKAKLDNNLISDFCGVYNNLISIDLSRNNLISIPYFMEAKNITVNLDSNCISNINQLDKCCLTPIKNLSIMNNPIKTNSKEIYEIMFLKYGIEIDYNINITHHNNITRITRVQPRSPIVRPNVPAPISHNTTYAHVAKGSHPTTYWRVPVLITFNPNVIPLGAPVVM